MDQKNILIIGSSGFLGSALLKVLVNSNIEICRGRDIANMENHLIQEMVRRNEVIINLAGYPVSGPWSKKKRKLILNSRILTTRKVVNAILSTQHKTHLINASAIGLYKPGIEADEFSNEKGKSFLAEVVDLWETEVTRLNNSNSVFTLARLGVVFGREGGAYPILRKLTKLNLGTFFSGGSQKISFVLLEDAVNSIKFIVENKITGPVNITAPISTDYKQFLTILKKKTKAIFLWNLPSFILKLFLGESSGVILDSHNVKPAVLLKNSFNFIASDIESCINNLENN